MVWFQLHVCVYFAVCCVITDDIFMPSVVSTSNHDHDHDHDHDTSSMHRQRETQHKHTSQARSKKQEARARRPTTKQTRLTYLSPRSTCHTQTLLSPVTVHQSAAAIYLPSITHTLTHSLSPTSAFAHSLANSLSFIHSLTHCHHPETHYSTDHSLYALIPCCCRFVPLLCLCCCFDV